MKLQADLFSAVAPVAPGSTVLRELRVLPEYRRELLSSRERGT
jgi:hypothetical protein